MPRTFTKQSYFESLNENRMQKHTEKLACLTMAFVILFFYLYISLKILSPVVFKAEKDVK